MDNEYWLICNQCGYTKKVRKEEIVDDDECGICGNRMILDISQGKKVEEPLGDNFPKFSTKHSHSQEQEIIKSIDMIGEKSTEEMIEAIRDVKLRLKYRMIFINLGYNISKKDIFIENEGKLYTK